MISGNERFRIRVNLSSFILPGNASGRAGVREDMKFPCLLLSVLFAAFTVSAAEAPAKNIGFNALDAAAEKINVPMLIIDAGMAELFDIRQNGGKVAEILKARGVPVSRHVLPDMSHYGIYREGFEEATRVELEWFDEHLKRDEKSAR